MLCSVKPDCWAACGHFSMLRYFPTLVQEWYEYENFSYGFLIRFIFLYVAFKQR